MSHSYKRSKDPLLSYRHSFT